MLQPKSPATLNFSFDHLALIAVGDFSSHCGVVIIRIAAKSKLFAGNLLA